MLTFNQVSLFFVDEQPALDDLSFEVNEGDSVLLTGRSGSGKTSIMRLLTREYTPNSGEIYFKGTSVHTLPYHLIPHHRRNIGVVFQDYKLLPELNVWENIALALSIIGTKAAEIEHRVTDLLHLVNLANKASAFPSQLSGGEAQRVSIARALSTAPDLLFADEPTGNLDGETGLNIIKLLHQINQLGTTLIITTHDPVAIDFLQKNSSHFHLDNGKLTIKNLLKNVKSAKKAPPATSETSEPQKTDQTEPSETAPKTQQKKDEDAEKTAVATKTEETPEPPKPAKATRWQQFTNSLRLFGKKPDKTTTLTPKLTPKSEPKEKTTEKQETQTENKDE